VGSCRSDERGAIKQNATAEHLEIKQEADNQTRDIMTSLSLDPIPIIKHEYGLLRNYRL
jgi:hypothetical protein